MKLNSSKLWEMLTTSHQWFVREDLTLTCFLKELGLESGDFAEVNEKTKDELFSDVLETLKKIN